MEVITPCITRHPNTERERIGVKKQHPFTSPFLRRFGSGFQKETSENKVFGGFWMSMELSSNYLVSWVGSPTNWDVSDPMLEGLGFLHPFTSDRPWRLLES